MNKDKHPPHGPQLLPLPHGPRVVTDLATAAEVIPRLREYLPRTRRSNWSNCARCRVCPSLRRLLRPRDRHELGRIADQKLEPEQAPEQACEEFDLAYWEQASEQLIERVSEQILPEQIDRVSEAEQPAGQLPEQSAEQIADPVPKPIDLSHEQIEQAMQAAGRPRHRPRIEFPHLKESLADLEKNPHFKNMQPKEEVAFVMARLRQYGDTVEDRQEKTLSRRIAEWHADRTKRAR